MRGGCELKDAAKATSFSVAGYKRGRDQATSRGKASSQGLNPKMTLVAQRKMRKASSLLLLREGNAAIGYPYKEYKLQSKLCRPVRLQLVLFVRMFYCCITLTEQQKTDRADCQLGF